MRYFKLRPFFWLLIRLYTLLINVTFIQLTNHPITMRCFHAKSLQSCLPLWNPITWSLPGSSVHGILKARVLEWLPCPPPGDLPDPGIKPLSLLSPALTGGFFTTSNTREALHNVISTFYIFIALMLTKSPHYLGARYLLNYTGYKLTVIYCVSL